MKTKNLEDVRKFLKGQHDPLSQLNKLKTYNNAFNTPLFETEYCETIKIQILPDPKIKRATFIPDKIQSHIYYAHPVTIKAMRKDLFMGGEDFIDLEELTTCESCKSEIDKQFWIFCPFCEA